MKKNIQFIQGFTLIETVLYTALFSILMSVAVVSGYSLVLGGSKVEQSFLDMDEQRFINSKLNLLVNSTRQVLLPAPSQSGNILKAELFDGRVCSFDLLNMLTWCGNDEPELLVGASFKILETEFANQPATSLSPRHIRASYRLNGQLVELDYFY